MSELKRVTIPDEHQRFIDPTHYHAPLETEQGYIDFYPSKRCGAFGVLGQNFQIFITSYEMLPVMVNPDASTQPPSTRQTLNIKTIALAPNARISLDFETAVRLRDELTSHLDIMRAQIKTYAADLK